MNIILIIAFILILIHTALLWNIETSELSDNNNVASEAKVQLILYCISIMNHIYFSFLSGSSLLDPFLNFSFTPICLLFIYCVIRCSAIFRFFFAFLIFQFHIPFL